MLEITGPLNRRMTNEEARNLLDQLIQKVDPMTGKAADLIPVASTVEEAVKRIPKPGQIVGLSTGYADIDKMTGGLAPGEVSVWYGGTSTGKSQLTQNIALNMAQAGIPMLMLPLEMGVYLNTARLMTLWGPDNAYEFAKLPIYYPDTKRMDVTTLANTVRDGVDKLGIRAVVVDQLQQLVPRTGANLVEAISSTTDELHKIADESQVHILLISHINRTGDPGTAPKLSELKGSGSIEQDADICVGLYRDTEDDAPEKGYRSPLMLHLTKNRNRGTENYKASLGFEGMRLVSRTLKLQ